MLARVITTISAVLLILYGVVAALTPLPLGVVLIVIGLLMLASANPFARPMIRSMRRRWGWFDKLVEFAAKGPGARFQATVDATDPDKHPPPAQDQADRKD